MQINSEIINEKCFERVRFVTDEHGGKRFFLCDIADVLGYEMAHLIYAAKKSFIAPDGHLAIDEETFLKILQLPEMQEALKKAIERGRHD